MDRIKIADRGAGFFRRRPARYLPPCSGGNGHVCFADINTLQKTEGERPKALAETRFLLWRC